MKFDTEFYQSKDWEAARLERLKIDGYKCVKCSSTDRIQVHHIISIARGGSKTSMSNLMTLCYNHHIKEHPHMYKNFTKTNTFRPTRSPRSGRRNG